jgi:hypothetical protein
LSIEAAIGSRGAIQGAKIASNTRNSSTNAQATVTLSRLTRANTVAQ